MAKQYVLFHVELDRPLYPIGSALTKEEAEAELDKQQHKDQLEIREVDPPEEAV